MKSISQSTPAETANYIAGLAKELRAMAAKSDLGFLAYLLSMVEQEADAQAHGRSGSSGMNADPAAF